MSFNPNERVSSFQRDDNRTGEDSYASHMLRDKQESARLDLQHQLMTRSIGYLLHPTISQRLESSYKIADVATGTAIFLRDLSDQVKDPSMELHGFDISADQFPPAENLAPNITLHLSNAKKGFSEEYHGKFDVINIKLLTAAMDNPRDWYDVARNSMALLKPGGYIQWIEGSLEQIATVLCAVPGGDPEFSALYTEGKQKAGRWASPDLAWASIGWAARNLAGVLKEVGAVEVRQDSTSSDRFPEDRQKYAKMFTGSFRTVAGAFVGTPNGFKTMDELREWHEKIQEVAKREKVYMRFDIHTILARKAL